MKKVRKTTIKIEKKRKKRGNKFTFSVIRINSEVSGETWSGVSKCCKTKFTLRTFLDTYV